MSSQKASALPAIPAGGEQRQSPRKKVLLTGKIIYGDGAYVLDCTIQDLSASGARIALQNPQAIPENVFLLDLPNRIAYEIEVVSVRSNGLGVKFAKRYPLGQLNQPELRYLKRIWMQCAQ